MKSVCPNCGYVPAASKERPMIITARQQEASARDALAAVAAVMEVAEADFPGRTTPTTPPRLQWARNMLALILHDLGFRDTEAARTLDTNRITLIVRRRRMVEQLERSRRYRDFRAAIMARLDGKAAA